MSSVLKIFIYHIIVPQPSIGPSCVLRKDTRNFFDAKMVCMTLVSYSIYVSIQDMNCML